MSDRPPRVFPLAPMNATIRALTWILLALAPLLVVLGAARLAPGLGLVGGALGAMYTVIWLVARPVAFGVQPAALWLVFPLRRAATAWADVTEVRRLGPLKEELGVAMRVGVGGLWGAFGWLWTSRRGWVELYISRTDDLVLVERRNARPLLITPARPAAFIAEARARLDPPAPAA